MATLNIDFNVKNAPAAAKAINDVDKALQSATRSNERSASQNKVASDSITGYEQRLRQLTSVYKSLTVEERDSDKTKKYLIPTIQRLNGIVGQNRGAILAANGSYAQAQQRLTALGNSIRNAEGGFNSKSAAVRRQITEYRTLNDQLKTFDARMGNNFRNVGNYVGGLAGGIPVLGQLTTAVGAVALAFQGLQKSFTTNLKLDALEYSMRQITDNATKFDVTMNYLRQTANRLGLDFVSTVEAFKQWDAAAKYSSLSGEQTRKIFDAVANAGAKLKLSNEQVQGTFLALSQMMSKGVVSMEELRRQLGDRIPGAFQLAAKGMGMTEAELSKLVSTGQLASDEFLPKFAEQLDKSFGNKQTEKIESLQASVNRLSTEFDLLFKSDRATSFFKTITDGLSDIVSESSKVLNSSSFKELLVRLSGIQGASVLGDAVNLGQRMSNLNPTQRATFGYADKEVADRQRILEVQKQTLDLRIKEYNLNPNARNKEELVYANSIYAEMIKINSELGLYDSKNKAVLETNKENKKHIEDISKLQDGILKDSLNYYDAKLFDINKKYDEIYQKVKNPEFLNLAKQNEQADKLKLTFEEWANSLEKVKKTFSGLDFTFGEASVPSTIKDRVFKTSATFDTDLSTRVITSFRRSVSSSLNDISKSLVSSFQDMYEIEDKYAQLRKGASAEQIQSLNKQMKLEKQINNGLSNLFISLGNGLGSLGGSVLTGAVSGGISTGDFKDLRNLFKGDNKNVGYGSAASLVGGAIQNLTPKKSYAGQILGGALAGAGTGLVVGGWVGAIVGGVVGAISGIFSASSANKQAKLQEEQLNAQNETNELLRRQNALAFTSQIIGQQTNQGIVSGVERNEFGDVVFEIEGRKLKAVLDTENAAQARGL